MSLRDRVAALPWEALGHQLDQTGHAGGAPLLGPLECEELVALYAEDARFRKRIVMERHAFGKGDYAYFADPLPDPIATLREALYLQLAPIANRWQQKLGQDEIFPEELGGYLELCHAAGQTQPTPLLLHYEEEGFNCLHRDLYGDWVFPIQAMVMLSRPGQDFEGGEFLVVENRARQQARGSVRNPALGELTLFAVNERPAQGKRGAVRASTRHGVSPVHWGERYTLGVIFHDAA